MRTSLYCCRQPLVARFPCFQLHRIALRVSWKQVLTDFLMRAGVLVNEATDTVAEDVAPLQPRRQRKRKTVVVDAGEASHPPKKLKMDHETPSRPSVAGKSRSVVQRLLARAVLNADVRGGAIPTLPFVTSSVSATPEREGGDHTDSMVGHNLRTIGVSQRFVISSDSSHHSGPTIAEAEVDSLARSSIPLMTTVTTVTATVDPTLVVICA
ncbi:hypothetical protein Tco_1573691 [Tanacetum coccineum]